MSFKDNLRDEMEFQDMKQKELSEKTGISVNTIRNYINGHNALPSAEVAVKIAGALGVSVEYLVSGKKSGVQKIPFCIFQSPIWTQFPELWNRLRKNTREAQIVNSNIFFCKLFY